MWPHRRQPTRLPHSWDSPGKNTGVGCHFFLQYMKVKSESEVAQLCLTLSDPWIAAYQAPLSMGFSRQEYWSGVPLLSPTEPLVNVKIEGYLCLFWPRKKTFSFSSLDTNLAIDTLKAFIRLSIFFLLPSFYSRNRCWILLSFYLCMCLWCNFFHKSLVTSLILFWLLVIRILFFPH